LSLTLLELTEHLRQILTVFALHSVFRFSMHRFSAHKLSVIGAQTRACAYVSPFHCQMNSEIRRVMSTASNSSLKQFCSALTSVTSALKVNF